MVGERVKPQHRTHRQMSQFGFSRRGVEAHCARRVIKQGDRLRAARQESLALDFVAPPRGSSVLESGFCLAT